MARSRTSLVLCALAALSTGLAGTAVATSPPAAAAAPSAVSVPGRGATVPFVEQEAESAATNGTAVGPSRTYGALPSEASGRRAVTLDAPGEYVRFTLGRSTNSLNLRYSIPDGPGGAGRDASAEVLVNGAKVRDLALTSRYGWYYGSYPFTNNPGDGKAHHFYDEARTLLPATVPAGATITVRLPDTSRTPSLTVDLADFEQVAAPAGRPAGSIDAVADFGADPTGARDSSGALQAAIDAGRAQKRTVYVPRGRFKVTRHLIVDAVTITGAGQWHTELTGDRVGIYGRYVGEGGPSRNVKVSRLAVIGEVKERNDGDQVNAFGGAMSDSVIDDVWMQHTKVGAWMDGPMNSFAITNSRILDQTADGVNFHTGVTNSKVTNTFVRGTGDDGLAMWAENVPNVNNTFSRNTVVAPVLANNIAIYGGRDITVSDNVVAETVTNGGGLHVANRYPGVSPGAGTAVAGTFTLARNTLIRTGGPDVNWNFGVGALWFDGQAADIAGATVNVTDTDILDSSFSAIQTVEGKVSGLRFSNVRIDGAGTFALQLQSPGGASFERVVASDVRGPRTVANCLGGTFALSRGAGNAGWTPDAPFCGPWPARVEGSGNNAPAPQPPAPNPPAPQPPAPQPPAPQPPAAGGQSYVSALNGLCLDVPGSRFTDGAKIQTWTCNGTPAQRFTPDAGRLRSSNGLCLDAAGGATANGTLVQLAACSGNRAQQFTLNAAGDLVNANANRCVDIKDVNRERGAAVHLWDCVGAANQKWARR